MPAKINLSQAGLRRSSRLKELRKTDEKNEASVSLATTTSKRKAHAPFGSSSLKKAITLFALLSNVQDSSILSHSLPPNPTTMQRLQNRIEPCMNSSTGLSIALFILLSLLRTDERSYLLKSCLPLLRHADQKKMEPMISPKQWRKKSTITNSESIGLW